ncbi:MAG: peptidoglycan editing factor PgeF [Pyrinomonadaceae bacterium]
MDTIISRDNSDGTLADAGFIWREREGILILISTALADAGFTNAFSTRIGGVSPFPEGSLNLAGFDEDSNENIAENRRRFLAAIGGDYHLTSVWQVHGDGVKAVISEADADNTEDKYDALTSIQPGLLVGVKTADCVPILIGDSVTGTFAAVHAGWRGTVQSIVQRTIDKLTVLFDANPNDLICAVGPSACGRNYEIGNEVIDAFYSKFSNIERYFTPTRDGHALVDLQLINSDQLISTGVRKENIYTAPLCTMERTDLFFSYRVEKKPYGKTGRLMSVIGKASP